MNQANTITPIKLQRSTLPILWLFIALLVFTACLGGGGGDNAQTITGDTVQLERGTQGTVACTAVCSQWGQCGARTDNGAQVVLAGQGGPAVINQELIFPHNTPVQIDGHEARILQPIVGGDPMNMNFYYVISTDGTNKGGWVAGWCVQAASN